MPRGREAISGLRAKLAAQILRHVVEQGFEKGHHLIEASLAERLNVSRSPVRAALKLLESRGIIEQERNRGYFLKVSGKAVDIAAVPLPVPDDEKLYTRILADRLARKLDDVQTETELMRRYRTTRSNIRRVLARLTKERVIERSPGVGWTFMPVIQSKRAYFESYRLRLILEPAGLMEPTFTIDQRRLEKARDHHRTLIRTQCRNISPVDMFHINADFHEMLASFSNNRFIAEIMQQQNVMRRLLEYEETHDRRRMVSSCEEHLEVLTALEAGDRDWAATLLRRHLEIASKIAADAAIWPEDGQPAAAPPPHPATRARKRV